MQAAYYQKTATSRVCTVRTGLHSGASVRCRDLRSICGETSDSDSVRAPSRQRNDTCVREWLGLWASLGSVVRFWAADTGCYGLTGTGAPRP